jgi:hypothetical protein
VEKDYHFGQLRPSSENKKRLAGESKIGFGLCPTVRASAFFFWTLFRRSRLFPLVGIDLGTTNSLVAALEGGEPVVITTAQGSRLLSPVC